jgi:RimJ/RimL family protein N-acetyltransferase
MDIKLRTERLQLRWLTLDDAELMLAVWNDPAFVRFVGDRGIRTVDEARMTMEEGTMKLYSDHGYGPFRMALADSDEPIGICGLFRREGLDDPDIGFATLPEFCGRGFAFEAACAVIDHARDELGLPRLIAIVSPENEASVGLIRKLGLRFERMYRMAGDDDDIAIYGVQLLDMEEK